MKIHVLDVDSRGRDPTQTPNDYTVMLDTPIYDVTKISLLSARLKTSQLLVNATNNTFFADGNLVTLDSKNVSNGFVLASDLLTKLEPPISNVSSVIYTSNTNALTFSNVGSDVFTLDFSQTSSPFDILGIPASNIQTSSYTSGSVNLEGPDAFVLKLSSGAQSFDQKVFTHTPFYTAMIPVLTQGTTTYSTKDGPIDYEFYSGPLETLSSLRIQFYYMTNMGLKPYDFRNANHLLRFEITCSTDKNETIPKIERNTELPPPLSLPEFEFEERTPDYKVYAVIAIIILVGVFIIVYTRPTDTSSTPTMLVPFPTS